MSREVDSLALALANRALGIAGPGSGQTELEDGLVSQVLDVGQVAARSRAPGTGLFWGRVLNIHEAVETLTTDWDPYEPVISSGATGVVAPWPIEQGSASLVPSQWDLFLLDAYVNSTEVTDFASASIELTTPATVQGFGLSNTGGVITAINGGVQFVIAHWDAAVAIAGNAFATTGEGIPRAPIRRRIRRGETLTFHSTSDTTGTISITLMTLWALQPVCFGQNVAV